MPGPDGVTTESSKTIEKQLHSACQTVQPNRKEGNIMKSFLLI